MGLFRQVRRQHKITVDGPATITILSGRASVVVDADKVVKIQCDKPAKKSAGKSKLTGR